MPQGKLPENSDAVRTYARVAGWASIVGPLVLGASTFLHPSSTDPNDPLAAFAEYAADATWVVSHLGQFLGAVAVVVALLCIARVAVGDARSEHWALFGAAGAASSIACAAALQAVDGFALKATVDRWALSSGAGKDILFSVALGIRQVEIGLASLSSLVFGLTLVAYALALLKGSSLPRWLGVLALPPALASLVGGALMAFQGFSPAAMTMSLSSGVGLFVWLIVTALQFRRRVGINA